MIVVLSFTIYDCGDGTEDYNKELQMQRLREHQIQKVD